MSLWFIIQGNTFFGIPERPRWRILAIMSMASAANTWSWHNVTSSTHHVILLHYGSVLQPHVRNTWWPSLPDWWLVMNQRRSLHWASEPSKLVCVNMMEKITVMCAGTCCRYLFWSLYQSSARNNSRPLAIFWPNSVFDQAKLILFGQIYCTFSMGSHYISNLPKTSDQFLNLLSGTFKVSLTKNFHLFYYAGITKHGLE